MISGYLITTILLEDLENKRFSILDFYERRARRILPALFFVMLVCIPFAWMWMQPRQMNDFLRSIVSVSLFASNMLFWQENSYFAPVAEEKPLLHTWSLAVEEQYYVLFPIFLFWVWRFGKSKACWAIAFLAAVSFAVCEWGSRTEPVANFYLAPTRAWELLAGSIAAFVVQKRGLQNKNLLSMFGLFAIIFAMFAYDKTTPFPSAYTSLPVFGVVLLILFSGKETVTTKLMSNRVLVGIGLISYSFYLWHQPLFAFARIRSIDEPSFEVKVLLVFLSLGLAIISWKCVENPFRNRSLVSKKSVLFFSLGMIATLSGFGLLSLKYKIGKNQDGKYDETIIEREKMRRFYAKQEICNLKTWEKCNDPEKGKINVLVIGDSHAADALNALYHATVGYHERISFSTSDLGGCGPHQDTEKAMPNISKNKLNCVKLNRQERYNLDFLKNYNVIVISFLVSGKTTVETLGEYINYLNKNYTGKVIVFGSTFIFKKELPDIINRRYLPENNDSIIKSSPLETEKLLQDYISKTDAIFLSKYNAFCYDTECTFALENGKLITYDKHHLSVDFANKLGDFYRRDIVKNLVN